MAKNKYGIEMWDEQNKLSHNIYSEDSEITSTLFAKYLILVENERRTEIIPCTCLTTAIEIASNEKSLCRLFERIGSMGKHWSYKCDISKGVI